MINWKQYLILIWVCVVLAGCASTKSQVGEVVSIDRTAPSSDGAKSQKKDPNNIYGDAMLNEAYALWASKGFPKHPASGKYSLDGKASWYGPGLNGNKTANGEVFDMNAMTSAHKKLPFGSIVVVTNLNNNQSVVVRINDRMPSSNPRVIDMSYGSAYLLKMIKAGVVPVHIEIIRLGKDDPFFDELKTR